MKSFRTWLQEDKLLTLASGAAIGYLVARLVGKNAVEKDQIYIEPRPVPPVVSRGEQYWRDYWARQRDIRQLQGKPL